MGFRNIQEKLEKSETANIVLGTLARFVFCAFKPERIVERSTAAKIWCSKGPSINYVVSKSAIFDPFPLGVFFIK